MSINNKGKNNPNYKNGNRIKGNYPCQICKKNIFREKRRSNIRCKDCYNKDRAKNKKSRSEISKKSYEKNKEKRLKKIREYRSRPEIKIKKRKKQLEYSRRPEIKKRRKAYTKEYCSRPETKEKSKLNSRKRRKNPKIRDKERANQRTKEHRERVNKKRRERMKNDKNFAIQHRLRRLLHRALVEYGEGKKWKSSKYGINYQAIIEHLRPFPEKLSEYHIDHIKPLCSFDLTKPEQIKKAFAPSNHQWLTIQENLKKGSRFDNKLFKL